MADPLPRRSRGSPLLLHPLAVAAAALCWLLLRTGRKPSRIVYPCQQAAFSTALAGFAAPLLAAALALRKLAVRLPSPAGVILPAAWLTATAGLAWLVLWGGPGALPETPWSTVWGAATAGPPPALSAAADYRARVFHQTACAQQPDGDRFPGLDDLIEMMGAQGQKFYRWQVTTLTAGPEGIIAADDVVVVKINYQWPERGGTNTDLLRGLIRRILDHPAGFAGEIVVCENAQFNSTENFDRAWNNADDTSQSPHDVVARFQGEGARISHFDWTPIRTTQVLEYSAGDARNGYIVFPYDAQFLGRKSYPKFQTSHGTRISLKYGLWNGAAYDRGRLKLINVPVLKSHHSTYGATACVKHFMGVVTRELSTFSHTAIANGILGAVMGEVGAPDLNILDCIWINADPDTGPQTPYGGALRRDMLVASRDPVAADIWAVKNILIPGFYATGHSPPWPTPSADPDDPNSAFRRYLDRSMQYMLAAGIQTTNDLSRIDLTDLGPPGEASDRDGTGAPFTISQGPGGYELAWSAPIRGGAVVDYTLYRTPLGGGGGGGVMAAPVCEGLLGTATSAMLPALADNCGFLVVAGNAAGEGSFGRDSRGRERPSPAPGEACP